MGESFLLREVTAAGRTGDDVMMSVRAVRCAPLAETPGYVTGEPLSEQGIETSLPLLPELDLPPLESCLYEFRVQWAAPGVVRITAGPAQAGAGSGAGARVTDSTWLGIVTCPRFDSTDPDVVVGSDEVTISTKRMRVRVRCRPFALAVDDLQSGRTILRTAQRLRQVAGFPMAPAVLADERGITLHLELGTHEDVLGFGEQFGRLVKNGQRLELRVHDALGTGTGRSYKPVPTWHSTSGYTGFLNTGAVVTADVGHLRPSVFGLTVADQTLDLYVLSGDRPRERLRAYTMLTGRSVVPPLWAFGYWMGRCRYHSRKEMEDVGRRMREHAVPCDVLHLDPHWLVHDRLNCDFIWNTERFGQRRALVQVLRALDLRLSVWELPYLDPESPRYVEAEEKGYLVTDGHGRVVPVEGRLVPDGRPRALVDFSNAEARAWWQEMHAEFFEDGVAVFKTDFGEGLPDTAVLADGTPSNHAHNLYPLRYNAAVSEATARHAGGASIVWGRSGWAGSQRYPAQWSGDAESTVAGMQATLRGGLSYALSAPGFWSHDIGGFFGPELTPGLYVRWTQMGALSPLMRAHGLRAREPWAFGDRALNVAREWVRLRYEVLPYLWQVAHESARGGWPMLRPLSFEYPDDPVARRIDDAFLLGSDLLVVPVFDDGNEAVRRSFYVPAGMWTDWFTGCRYAGPAFHESTVPLERIPLLVRDGAVFPTVGVDTSVRSTASLLTRPWQLHVFTDADIERDLVGFDGATTAVTVSGPRVESSGGQPLHRDVVRMPVETSSTGGLTAG